LRMRACAHRHRSEYLVLLRVSTCLVHRVGWCRESSGTSALRWVLVFTRASASLSIFRAIILHFLLLFYTLFPSSLSSYSL
jgi:hypothetical protein